MNRRSAVRVARLLLVASALLATAGAIVAFQGRAAPVDTVFASRRGTALMGAQLLIFAGVAAIVASRRPRNPIGWLLSGGALLGSAWLLADAYAVLGLVVEPGPWPGAVAAAWVGNWLWVGMWGLVAALGLLLFPDGRWPSPRWRLVAWAVVAVAGIYVAGLMLAPGPLVFYAFQRNPVGLAASWAQVLGGALPALELTLRGLTVAAAASLLFRLAGAQREVRAQIKWVAYAGAMTAAMALATQLPMAPDRKLWLEDLTVVVGALPAVALGVAMLRYRLYEIDRLISRTVSYVLLTGLLAAVYLGVVFALQGVLRTLTGESQLAVAGATLAVAALFQPARHRVQFAVDRRFNRARYDAQRTVEEFRARLRDEVDLHQLDAALVGAVRRSVEPVEVSLWLRTREAAADR